MWNESTPSMELKPLAVLKQVPAGKGILKDKKIEIVRGNKDGVIFLGGGESFSIKELPESLLGRVTISVWPDDRTQGQSESGSQNNQQLGRDLTTSRGLTTIAYRMVHLTAMWPTLHPNTSIRRRPINSKTPFPSTSSWTSAGDSDFQKNTRCTRVPSTMTILMKRMLLDKFAFTLCYLLHHLLENTHEFAQLSR